MLDVSRCGGPVEGGVDVGHALERRRVVRQPRRHLRPPSPPPVPLSRRRCETGTSESFESSEISESSESSTKTRASASGPSSASGLHPRQGASGPSSGPSSVSAFRQRYSGLPARACVMVARPHVAPGGASASVSARARYATEPARGPSRHHATAVRRATDTRTPPAAGYRSACSHSPPPPAVTAGRQPPRPLGPSLGDTHTGDSPTLTC